MILAELELDKLILEEILSYSKLGPEDTPDTSGRRSHSPEARHARALDLQGHRPCPQLHALYQALEKDDDALPLAMICLA